MPPFTPDFEGATDTCNFDVVEDGLTAMVSGGGVGTCAVTPACPHPAPFHKVGVRRVPTSCDPKIISSPESLLYDDPVLGTQP